MGLNQSPLIIGTPKSGKTTFLAQLFFRMQAGKGRLRMTKASTNIGALKNACGRLSKGLETETTAADDNLEIIIPVSLDESEFDLVCQDYGGEQVRNISSLLGYEKSWKTRAKTNDRWILFIRPNEVRHPYDLSHSGHANPEAADTKVSSTTEILSHQYHFIELMQALLHARDIGSKSRIDSPTVLVVLTCWDELATDGSPYKVLQDKMPLFQQFLKTNWNKSSYKVIGLSSQGFKLEGDDDAKDKYLDDLPESFGYLILEDGTKDKDLTKLIEIAIKL